MNVYDTANKLAGEIKQSEEYMNYKMAKQALSLNSKLKEQLQEFEKIRYEVQVELMQTGKNNEEKYTLIFEDFSENELLVKREVNGNTKFAVYEIENVKDYLKSLK